MNKIKQFLLDLRSPEMYGHAVSNEVRKEATKLLTEIDNMKHDSCFKHDDWLDSMVPGATMETLETEIFDLKNKVEDLNEELMSMQYDIEYYEDFAGEVRKFMTTSTDPRAAKFLEEFNTAWIGVTHG
jgi:hypothetical protein